MNAKVDTPESKKDAALAIAPPKFLVQLGEELACNPEELKRTIFATCMYDGATGEEFRTYLMVANRLELNPLTGEVYALKKKGGGIQTVVGKNGWNTILNRNASVYDGRELSYWFKMGDNSWKEFPQPIDGDLVMVTCKLFRKDRDRPEVAHARYDEYYKETTYDSPWKTYLTTMMEHKAYNKAAAAAFGMADAIDADDAREFCEIRNAGSAARQDFKARGLYETPDGRLERDVTPPAPEMPQAGATTAEPIPPRPKQNGAKRATPRAYGYMQGMAVDKGDCPDKETFKKFLEAKGVALPISHEDCSALIQAFEVGDFSELHEFLGAPEDVPEERPPTIEDDFLPGMSDDKPEGPEIDEEKTKLFNDILDLKLADGGAEIYAKAIDHFGITASLQELSVDELHILKGKMVDIQDGDDEDKKPKKKSGKK